MVETTVCMLVSKSSLADLAESLLISLAVKLAFAATKVDLNGNALTIS